MFSIIAIKLLPRSEVAPTVQEVLTKHGCIIKTRVGFHEASKETCSQAGLILLDLLNDDKDEIIELLEELNSIEHVTAKLLEL